MVNSICGNQDCIHRDYCDLIPDFTFVSGFFDYYMCQKRMGKILSKSFDEIMNPLRKVFREIKDEVDDDSKK